MKPDPHEAVVAPLWSQGSPSLLWQSHTVLTAGRLELDTATATTAAFILRARSIPAPLGGDNKAGMGFQSSGRGWERACVYT